MKFVCIECDEPMTFAGAGELNEGSLPVSFRCPACEWGFTMLTNPQETQMVRSLGVKIGGATVPPAPMEMMRTFLSGTAPHPPVSSETTTGEGAGKCPFAAVVKEAAEKP
ncbi:MAG: hypothetical protein QNK37_34430 [Acidobacteriota bacterium]|nr:hypothetical protein [Acidobacteriota bacterium]